MIPESQSHEPQKTTTGDGPCSSTESSSAGQSDHPFGFYSRSYEDSVWDSVIQLPGHIGKQLAEKWSTRSDSDTTHASPAEPDQEH
ncbi:hypothetical protein [Streptomyces sp. DSM 118148]|uniref:hypothetical protein n=1 Tax=Streptomyces sp. DSM 118148 TaxID=3448667 RepID=UPI00404023E6